MGLRDVFPDVGSAVVCVAYMGSFVLQGLLTRASQINGAYHYNTSTAVLTAELLKLLLSVAIYLSEFSVVEFAHEFIANVRLMTLYFVPALLYCVYNNLAFINLANYDPATYYLLLQFRVVVTGVLFQVLFNKRLSRKQWLSLLVLTSGCVIKEHGRSTAPSHVQHDGGFFVYTGLIMIQVLCSCFAGVYNERLLKGEGQNVHLMVQNCYMYLCSVVANLLFMAVQGGVLEALSWASVRAIAVPSVLAVCVNNAMIGIITSLFLKRLNSVVKVYASAVELLATAYLSWLVFGIPVDRYTFVALFLIAAASIMYSMYPIKPHSQQLPS